jgi:hypothetical protein
MEQSMQGEHEGAINVGGGVSLPEGQESSTPGPAVQSGSVTMHPTDAMQAGVSETPEIPDIPNNPAPPAGADAPTEQKGHDHNDKWDDNDVATLQRLIGEGKNDRTIAQLMGRTPKAVQSKRYRLSKSR